MVNKFLYFEIIFNMNMYVSLVVVDSDGIWFLRE